MSKVYKCAGSCHGESDKPGECQSESCELQGQQLQEKNKCDNCNAAYELDESHQCEM